MGYPEVFEKLACNYIAFLSLGDLSKLDKYFHSAPIRAMKQPRQRKLITFLNYRLGGVICFRMKGSFPFKVSFIK